MGPVMAEARVGGIQTRGLRTMLPICSILVPRPWATRPPQRFSRKLITAKPIIWAQHPATAAPPARPVSPRAAQMAAEEMGRVRATPITTDTMMPMKKGCSSAAHMMNRPTALAAAPMGAAIRAAMPMPESTVTMGVTRMSTFVSLLTALPISLARIATNSTARGPPAPPMKLVAKPTGIREYSTRGGASSARPMATAMPGPTMAEHRPPMV